MMEQWLQLWSIRNKEKHGQDQESQHRVRYGRVLHELTKQYELRPAVVPCDRQIFFQTATQHMQAHKNLDVIEDWILSHRSAITASADQAQRTGIQRNRTIDEYFPRVGTAAAANTVSTP